MELLQQGDNVSAVARLKAAFTASGWLVLQ